MLPLFVKLFILFFGKGEYGFFLHVNTGEYQTFSDGGHP